jgi:hypothetical protein
MDSIHAVGTCCFAALILCNAPADVRLSHSDRCAATMCNTHWAKGRGRREAVGDAGGSGAPDALLPKGDRASTPALRPPPVRWLTATGSASLL